MLNTLKKKAVVHYYMLKDMILTYNNISTQDVIFKIFKMAQKLSNLKTNLYLNLYFNLYKYNMSNYFHYNNHKYYCNQCLRKINKCKCSLPKNNIHLIPHHKHISVKCKYDNKHKFKHLNMLFENSHQTKFTKSWYQYALNTITLLFIVWCVCKILLVKTNCN